MVTLTVGVLGRRPFRQGGCLDASVVARRGTRLALVRTESTRQRTRGLGTLRGRISQCLSSCGSRGIVLVNLYLFLLIYVITTTVVFHDCIIGTGLGRRLTEAGKRLGEIGKRLRDGGTRLGQLGRRILRLARSHLIFFAGVDRRLHAPLALVTSPIRVLLRSDNVGKGDHRLLGVIGHGTMTLRRLIDDVLSFQGVRGKGVRLALCHFSLIGTLGV